MYLRSLAVEPPKDNAQECLRLMGMALKNLASAMNNTQALEAAAIILGSEPTPSAIAYRNNVSNNLLTTYQQPTKVVGMVVGSDALTENSRVEKTAHAPLRSASPSRTESASELEELPVAMDCTTLALVDDVQGESALLIGESQDCSVEARDCHEGTCSAAPVSLNQSEIFELLDRANLGECPPLWVIQYLLDSKHYASMRATISKFEKQWNISVGNYQVQESSEALFTTEDIAMRSKARLLRMEKLKMASLIGENPGFDFLQQCWNDDPALQIVIKKLLAKFPQWGVAVVDGVLVKWNE